MEEMFLKGSLSEAVQRLVCGQKAVCDTPALIPFSQGSILKK